MGEGHASRFPRNSDNARSNTHVFVTGISWASIHAAKRAMMDLSIASEVGILLRFAFMVVLSRILGGMSIMFLTCIDTAFWLWLDDGAKEN